MTGRRTTTSRVARLLRLAPLVWVSVVAAGACSSCDDEPATRAPAPAAPAATRVPGTLYVVEGEQLVRIAQGTRTVLGAQLYPSAHRLPDGRLVAIASRGDGSSDAEQLALVAPDGQVERVGPAAMQVRDPAVDPRGRWIVIAANLDGHSDLYRVELDGRPTERLTRDPAGNFHPVIIGDARAPSIIHVSSRDGNAELYRGTTRLTSFHRDDWEPTPSPRGDVLAFLSDREGPARIFLMAPDGTTLRRLTSHPADAGDEGAPTWSRDGRLLAYTLAGKVHVHDLATSTSRAVTPDGAIDHEPAFSPDGTQLAVARMRAGTRDSDVWIVSLTRDVAPVELARGARLPRWF